MKKTMKTLFAMLLLGMLFSFSGITALAENDIVTTVGDISVPGNGTAANPYLISTEEQLLLIANSSLPNALQSRYKLQNDITVTQETWMPIGYDNKSPFSGSFDGNGYTISGINVEIGYTYSGFFGVNTGYIKHLRIDVSINSGGCSGSLIARNEGVILDCFSSGTITSTGNQVGGLVGLNFSGTIGYSGSTTTVSGKECVGGLIGQHQAYYVNNTTIIHNSYAQGNIIGTTNVGGLVGRMYETNNMKPVVENCYASGIVNNGKGGGLLGSGYGTYYNSYYNVFNTGNQRGFAVSTEELKDQNTFYLWDFEYKWAIDNEFPYIRYTEGTSESSILDGAGTIEDPYLVRNEKDLRNVQGGKGTDRVYYYKLVNDIELTAKYWTPLNAYGEFEGVFNGNGHTISGLNFSSTNYDAVGLFGYNSGTIKNLTVIGNIQATAKAGLLAGQNNGLLENCFSSGTVTSTGNEVGGLAGLNFSGRIRYCGSDATVSGKENVGGLVGQHQGYYSDRVALINDCYAQGNVNGNTNVGGLVGHMYAVYNQEPIIRDCYASGLVNNGQGCGLVGTGYNHGRYYNSYYNSFNAGNKRGFAVSLEELEQQDTFYQWDFDNVWAMDSGYPYIQLRDGDKSITFEGTGTKDFPYLVKTERQLLAIATERTHIENDVYYRLANDITLTAKCWTPIGLYEEFQGIFDGNGHTISNLNYTIGNYDCAGLFAYNNGTIKNLTVVGNIKATAKVGMLVGENNNGLIENCFSTGTVTSTGNEVGGLIGLNFSGRIRYCGSDATVSGKENVGGLVGQHQGYYSDQVALINDCYAQGDVSGNTNVGGLIGRMHIVYNQEPIVRDCYASGFVSGGTGGGLLGTSGGRYYNSYYYHGNAGNQRGFAVSPEELKQQDTFYQWNFDTVWKMDGGYPYIQLRDGDKSISFEGSGSEDFPYLIKTERQLYAMATDQARMGDNIYYQLANDIALTAKHWTPIGASVDFRGVFDGNGHTISNVEHVRSSINNIGFFGVNAGTIKNLKVSGDIIGKGNTGLLAATNYGLIENCLSEGTVVSNGDNAGGLVGYNDGGKIRTSGSFASVSGQNNVGGLLGYSNVSYSDGEITNCFAHGDVTGNSTVGGLVGYHYQYRGTFVLQYNYAIGKVSGNNKASGLLGGYHYDGTATMSDNYYNSETSLCTDTVAATPKTTAEMKTKDTYEGWNFDTIWAMDDNTLDGYPYLENVVTAEDNSMDAGGISFWLTLSGNPNTGTVYAGIYEANGTLKQLKDYPAQKIINIVFDEGMTGSYVKIMWWKEELVPMCPPQTIPLQ
ncbi:MAG: hypothetical protein IJ278_06035 [Clostridia bacterium]|nr:hypothetical protein [Clostridia bacterium]